VSDEPTQRLSGEQIRALKFAAHRQLGRWAKARPLSSAQRARRTALVAAVRALEDPTFGEGVELRAPDE
jgi:hypothetical protein